MDATGSHRRDRRLERRAPDRRGAHAAARAVRRRVLRRAAARHASLSEFPHRAVLDRRVRQRRGSRRNTGGSARTRRTTTFGMASATRRCCSRPRRATAASIRCTRARWRRCCRRKPPRIRTRRYCCASTAMPDTGSASRSTNRSTISRTSIRSSPGALAWSRPALGYARKTMNILRRLREQAKNYDCSVCGANHAGSEIRLLGRHEAAWIVRVTCLRCETVFKLFVYADRERAALAPMSEPPARAKKAAGVARRCHRRARIPRAVRW